MGYESKMYIMERYEINGNANGIEVATFDLCKMGWGNGFLELFDEEIDYEIWDGDEHSREDLYGDVCKFAPVGKVIEWLRNEVKHNDYRRLRPFLGLLEGFDESQWSDLQVVHYGH